MKQDRAKIVWLHPEWERLAVRAAPLVIGGMAPLDAFRAVQVDVFKNEKWRIRNLSSTWAIRNGHLFLEAAIKAIAPPPPSAAPVPVAAPKPNGILPAWMEEKIEREAEAEAARVRAIYDAKLADRIREKLSEPPPPIAAAPAAAAAPVPAVATPAPSAIVRAERDEAALRQQEQRPPRHDPNPRPSGRDEKPKVVVVGLWPSVRAEINAEFHEVLDLRFFENDARDLAVMQRHSRNAALVVCFEKCGHNIIPVLKREAKKFEITHGGSKHLLDRLTRFAVDGK